MNLLRLVGCSAISLCWGCAISEPANARDLAKGEFVGSTPCDVVSREFLGGFPTNTPCHCITWRLTLFVNESTGEPARYTLVATYGVPGRDDPNQLEEGPTIKLEGRWDIVHGSTVNRQGVVYRIHGDGKDKLVSFVQVAEDLLHFLDQDKTLRIGNAGWSYTLNRRGVGREN